jgi:hypothetical protein
MLPIVHANESVRIAIIVIAALLLVLRNVLRIRRWRSGVKTR